jgi:SAM-dependent methyltransferase
MAATRPPNISVEAGQSGGLRWRIVSPLFELLYRSRTLYWLASTIPFAGQWRVWQRLVLSRLSGHDVLEIGCGTGTLLADILEAGYASVAVDRSAQMVGAARRELRRRRVSTHPESLVQQAVAQRLPFEDSSFDCVVSTFPTGYIVDPDTLREIGRVLRPGGRLIVVLGASLLPTRAALRPFVWFQDLVYGRDPASQTVAEDSRGGKQPTAGLARGVLDADLLARTEIVRGPFWEAYLVLGEKTDSLSPPPLIQ